MRLKIEKYNQKCNVILNVVKDLNIQIVDFEILHFVQNDKMLVLFHFELPLFGGFCREDDVADVSEVRIFRGYTRTLMASHPNCDSVTSLL